MGFLHASDGLAGEWLRIVPDRWIARSLSGRAGAVLLGGSHWGGVWLWWWGPGGEATR